MNRSPRLVDVDVNWGRGHGAYHPVAPKPISSWPLCAGFNFARHLQRRSTPSDMRDIFYRKTELGREMAGKFNTPQICDMGQTTLLPLRRKECWGIFRPNNPTGSNPRSWVLEASMLTTRPPKPPNFLPVYLFFKIVLASLRLLLPTLLYLKYKFR
jgi:hypothetical protein